MASRGGQDLRASFKTFAESARLDVLLVSSSTFDAAALLESGSVEDVLGAPSRRNLFYDEQITLHVILRTKSSLDLVTGLLPSLDFEIGAHATDAVPDGRGNAASASGKHDLATATYSASEGNELVESSDQNFIVWKQIVPIPRPRVRLQRPAVYFTASLSPRKVALQTPADTPEKTTLTSYEPLPVNILEPLAFDPSLTGKKLYLPASKVTKVAPPAPSTDSPIRPIRGTTKRAFPIVPALYTKLRYSPAPDAIIASLHVEIAQLINSSVEIESVSMELPGGHVEDLSNSSRPIEAVAGDEDVFLFRASPGDGEIDKPYVAQLYISAIVAVDADCKAQLKVGWQSQIDLSQVVKYPAYKWSRPLSAHVQSHRLSTQSNRPLSADGKADILATGSVTFNFVAPPTVQCGADFSIDIQCINNSIRTRRFAIIDIQPKKSQRTYQRLSTSIEGTSGVVAQMLTSPPVERLEPFDILDLSPEVRIGPLPARACYETTWTFRAVKVGILDLGIFRIVDLDSMRTVDVKKLPTIRCVDNPRGNTTESQSKSNSEKVFTPHEWASGAPSFAITSVDRSSKRKEGMNDLDT